MEHCVHARRIDAHGSLAVAKEAEVTLDTDLAGPRDAMNPVELLLAALSACMLKGIERVKTMLHFQIEGAEVRLEAVRQDARSKLTLTPIRPGARSIRAMRSATDRAIASCPTSSPTRSTTRP